MTDSLLYFLKEKWKEQSCNAENPEKLKNLINKHSAILMALSALKTGPENTKPEINLAGAKYESPVFEEVINIPQEDMVPAPGLLQAGAEDEKDSCLGLSLCSPDTSSPEPLAAPTSNWTFLPAAEVGSGPHLLGQLRQQAV